MKKILQCCCVIVLWSVCAAYAGEPLVNYSFAGDATARLATLDTSTTEGLLQRMILLHNLAFKGDVTARIEAEELNKRLRKQIGETPLLQAYRGSLEMISISHLSKAEKVAGTFAGKVPFVDGPLDDLKEGFEKIANAVKRDPTNVQLLVLEVTAATEVGEYLPELLPVAYRDLLFLGTQNTQLDTAATFFYNISWAKYYHKRAINFAEEYPGISDWESRRLAGEYLGRACGYASTQALLDEANIWTRKVFFGE